MVHCWCDVFMQSWCSHCDRKTKGKTNKQTFLFISPLCFCRLFAARVCLGPRVCESSPATLLVFHSTVCRHPAVTSGPHNPLSCGCGMLHQLQREDRAASVHVGMLHGRAENLYFWRRQLAALVLLENGSRKKIKGAFPLACFRSSQSRVFF